MIDAQATLRRIALVAAALAISTWILRPELSSALVTRGDDLAYRGNAERARLMYRRAIAFDARNGVAEDRFVFSELMLHERAHTENAVSEASVFLSRVPEDEDVRMDRALGLQMLRRYAAASRDFAQIGTSVGDARALTFAGINALHAHEYARSRQLLRDALRLEPNDEPAKRALARIAS